MTILSLAVQVTCQTCGADLTANGKMRPDGIPQLHVLPCQTCLNRADDAAWTKGYEKCWADLNGNAKVVVA